MAENKIKNINLSLNNQEFYEEYGRNKTVSMFTLGCKVNQYETEAIGGIFEKAGYEIVDFEDSADVYVINTCTVTNLSDRKSRQAIRRAKRNNEDSVVAVIGCYAQTAPEEVQSIPGVNLILGTKERGKIVEYVEAVKEGKEQLSMVDNIMSTRIFEELKVDTYKERTRAFLKIQEGCSQFCAYCIIPYARGPIRSRKSEDVVNEVRMLADSGFKEIVLTGIHVASYGKDLKNTSLLNIIEEVHEIEGIERIRLGSIEPTTITEEFIEVARNLHKLCPHYHISLQSGCDATLKRMNRKYTTGEFRNVVKRLRDNIKDVALTTDVMVGFPGETEEEFEETYKFLDEISFSAMHIFKYSPRKGTPAASFEEQIPSAIKEERSKKLINLSGQKALIFNNSFIGRVLPVIAEQEVKEDISLIEGHSANYIRVIFKGNTTQIGKIINVRLEKAFEDYMEGIIVE